MSTIIADISNVSTQFHDYMEKEIFELPAGDSYDACCGKVYITRKRFFIIHCNLCDGKYENYKVFLKHVLINHYEDDETAVEYYIDASMESKDEHAQGQEDELEQEQEEEEEHEEQLEEEETRARGRRTNDVDAELCEYLVWGTVEPAEAAETAQSENGGTEDIDKNIIVEEILEISPVNEEAIEGEDDANSNGTVLVSETTAEKKTEGLVCGTCHRSYATRRKLRSHMRTHNEVRKFECDKCGLKFKESYNLKAHSVRHTGKKPFACTQCQKKFYTRTELATHERRHTGERPFTCKNCGLAFISSGSLTEHMKRHTNNRPCKCEYCGKRFFDTYQLKVHYVVHTKERNYVCKTCLATFTRSRSLAVHMRLHSDEKFYCEHCPKSFTQKQALLKHINSKHPQDVKMEVVLFPNEEFEEVDIDETTEYLFTE